ncbi:MAG: 4Fe-4S dicluster domain-containing protein [Bacillota bacterium]
MKDNTAPLRDKARALLADKAACVIGHARDRDGLRARPHFAKDERGVGALILDATCHHNLAKYLLDYPYLEAKVGIVLKGCDALALERLVADRRVDRAKVVPIGAPCAGMADPVKLQALFPGGVTAVASGPDGFTVTTAAGRQPPAPRAGLLLERCQACHQATPPDTELLAEPVAAPTVGPAAEVARISALPPADRLSFWQGQFSRCIRCYACRNVCPACSCRECVFDQFQPNWLGRRTGLAQTQVFHLTRAFHVAGRCVDCGECDRVCPVGLPLSALNRKLLQDAGELFKLAEPWRPGTTEPLGTYKLDDPEEFM